MNQIFIGIDISKDSFNFSIIDNSLTELFNSALPMNSDGFQNFKQILANYTNSIVAMESTGSYHANLLSFLLSFKKEVCLINLVLIKKFSNPKSILSVPNSSIQKILDDITENFIDQINKSKKDNLEILKSIKGIGDITACHFLAEIKDIHKFASKSKLIAFAGTDPSVRQSGSSIHSGGRISKKGSKSLRRYLYLMASGVMKFNNYFRILL